MVLWGTIVNALAIVGGGLLGLLLPKLSSGIRTTVLQGIGLAVCLLGGMMAMKADNILLLIFSLVVGGVLGEVLKIERGLEYIGRKLEASLGGGGNGKVAAGFVTTTLIYCVGAMAVLGSLDGGLRHNHDILYSKAMLDGFSAIMFASTLGVGVLFSAAPVFLYQGGIALGATFLSSWIGQTALDGMIGQITAVGGVLIVGVGLNVLEIKKINVANLLPAIAVAAVSAPAWRWISDWWSGL
ncbi:DUF554 domain-containing protein [Paenibacillus cymbidii]|uniref:DUF554 domain-containing protein n=1 Tax=Paenibacillus cymbidii TaxID=1639034 RepID=UPI001081F9FB|nr:DUF554 domain-containing protein [Paenibacillus cymbidii]